VPFLVPIHFLFLKKHLLQLCPINCTAKNYRDEHKSSRSITNTEGVRVNTAKVNKTRKKEIKERRATNQIDGLGERTGSDNRGDPIRPASCLIVSAGFQVLSKLATPKYVLPNTLV